MNKFWTSVIFGAERKLPPIEKLTDYPELTMDILSWIETLFPVSAGQWLTLSAEKNPYSEVFFFQQEERPDVPQRLVVKRFVTQLEHKSELDLDGLEGECSALTEVAAYNGEHGVYSPKLYGYNRELCCMAAEHAAGARFVNFLLDNPFRWIGQNSALPDYLQCLSGLGRWLKKVHSLPLPKTTDPQYKLDAIMDKNLAQISQRLDHLEKVRAADFSSGICQRILRTAKDLSTQIIKDGETLRSVHGDLTLVNMLYDTGKLTVLDLASFGPGLTDDDLARIYLDFFNIDSVTFFFTPANRGSLASAFFTGYEDKYDMTLSSSARFHLLKHALININMYTIHWGNRQFLNPFFCRILYHYQKKFLFRLIKGSIV